MNVRRRNTVAAIDVGSTKVSVLVGDVGDQGETRILGVGVAPASGLSRGVIDNIQSAREAVGIAVEKAEQACGMRILSAVVGISGNHIQSQNNRGIIAIPDRSRPISADDRSRVLESAGQISIPTNRQIVHVIPRGYWVEGTDLVSDPVGMFGGRLDAETHIISGAVSAIQNLTKCIEGAGVQVDEIVLESIASATSVLEDQERLQGVAVVDIGGSTTSVAVYDEGSVAHSACLPIAGSHLTHDLARVLRCPWESAEEVKCTRGAAYADSSMSGETVDIHAFGTQTQKTVPLDARMRNPAGAQRRDPRDGGARTEARRLPGQARCRTGADRRNEPAQGPRGSRGDAAQHPGPYRPAAWLFRALRPDRDARVCNLDRIGRVRARRTGESRRAARSAF